VYSSRGNSGGNGALELSPSSVCMRRGYSLVGRSIEDYSIERCPVMVVG